jgi:hypothetical protein
MQTRASLPDCRAVGPALVLASALSGCSPTFDWREVRPEGSAVAMMFPCRPVRQERTVRVGAATLPMQLHSCSAGDATFLLAGIDAADPGDVTGLLGAFRRQAVDNVAGTATEERPFQAPGATPNPLSARLRIAGVRADQRPVVAQAVFFVKGLRLYQASVLATNDASRREAVDTFFGAIRLP